MKFELAMTSSRCSHAFLALDADFVARALIWTHCFNYWWVGYCLWWWYSWQPLVQVQEKLWELNGGTFPFYSEYSILGTHIWVSQSLSCLLGNLFINSFMYNVPEVHGIEFVKLRWWHGWQENEPKANLLFLVPSNIWFSTFVENHTFSGLEGIPYGSFQISWH